MNAFRHNSCFPPLVFCVPEVWLQNVNRVKKILGGLRNSAHRSWWMQKIFCMSLWRVLICYNLRNREGITQKNCRENRDLLPLHALRQGSQRPKFETVQCLVCTGDSEQHLLSLTRSHRSFFDTFPGKFEPMKFSSGAMFFPKLGGIVDLAFILPRWGAAVVTDPALLQWTSPVPRRCQSQRFWFEHDLSVFNFMYLLRCCLLCV